MRSLTWTTELKVQKSHDKFTLRKKLFLAIFLQIDFFRKFQIVCLLSGRIFEKKLYQIFLGQEIIRTF